jgi:hypothetical protein
MVCVLDVVTDRNGAAGFAAAAALPKMTQGK